MSRRPIIRTGNKVYGADYWPRARVSRQIVDLLTAGDSASMFGLRRIGKSSVMEDVRAQLTGSGREVIALDVQSLGHLGNFVREFVAALAALNSGKQIAKELASSDSLPEIIVHFLVPKLGGRGAPMATAKDMDAYNIPVCRIIADRIADLPPGQRPILLLDEVVDLCENAAKNGTPLPQIESLLSQLTHWRKSGLPMLLTGSVGMHSWMRRNNININLNQDLNHIFLPPLDHAASDSEAASFINALADGENWSWWPAAGGDWLAAALPAHYPIVIQTAMRAIKDLPAAPVLDPAFCATLVRDVVHGRIEQIFFSQFDDRIKEYRPKVVALRDVIRAVVVAGCLPYPDFRAALEKADKKNADMNEAMLKEDGFITVSRSTGVRPGSPLVSLWIGG